MEIRQVNNVNYTGKIITKGKWTQTLAQAFTDNPEVKKLASGKYDIIGKMTAVKTHPYDVNHLLDESLYSLSISAKKENPSLLDRVKSFLGLQPKANITINHHGEDKMLKIMDKRIKADTLGKKLNICE